MNKLREIILYALWNKDDEQIDFGKYEMVLGLIGPEMGMEEQPFTQRIISYIMKTIEYNCVNSKITLTDSNILNFVTPAYCIDRAYEYVCFLSNDHESEENYAMKAR